MPRRGLTSPCRRSDTRPFAHPQSDTARRADVRPRTIEMLSLALLVRPSPSFVTPASKRGTRGCRRPTALTPPAGGRLQGYRGWRPRASAARAQIHGGMRALLAACLAGRCASQTPLAQQMNTRYATTWPVSPGDRCPAARTCLAVTHGVRHQANV